jgi:hypothetical protein
MEQACVSLIVVYIALAAVTQLRQQPRVITVLRVSKETR